METFSFLSRVGHQSLAERQLLTELSIGDLDIPEFRYLQATKRYLPLR